MVRFNEFKQLTENVILPQDQSELEKLFAEYYIEGNAMLGSYGDKVFDVSLIGKNMVNVHVMVNNAACSLNPAIKLTKIPFKIYRCTGIYRCKDNNLNTLENAPTTISGAFDCSNSLNLISLKHCPETVNGFFIARGNTNLKSLEGIEVDSKISGPLFLDYNESLPMLRSLVVKRGVKFLGQVEERVKTFQSIINQYAGQGNLKQSLLECQYALIKAGYKGNAKW
jgi:hypothetical protein